MHHFSGRRLSVENRSASGMADLCLFSFSYLFGLVGTLVAVPMAAAIGVLVRFLLDAYLKSDVYSGGVVPPAGDGAGQ